jgi:hypothetical protein
MYLLHVPFLRVNNNVVRYIQFISLLSVPRYILWIIIPFIHFTECMVLAQIVIIVNRIVLLKTSLSIYFDDDLGEKDRWI